MKKRVTGLLLAILAMALIALPGFATAVAPKAVSGPDMYVYLDGVPMESLVYQVHKNICYVTVDSFVSAMDDQAVIEEGDGVVAVAAITVTKVVDVDGEGKGVTAEANVVEEVLTLKATAGENYVVANGRYLYTEHGNLLVGGKVALPIRVLAKAFNLSVGYDGQLKAATLAGQEGGGVYLISGDSFYDSTELLWLSRIIYAESGNQSLAGKLAVGNVVMNRVNSPLFPNSVYSVIFQKNQFSPAASGSIYRTPTEACVIAAKLVLDGAVVLDNALFFNIAGRNSYASRNRPYITTIGAHAFYG